MNRKEVVYNIILILIGIPTLFNVSNFFVNILSVGKYYLYVNKYLFIRSPFDPLSNQFPIERIHVVWTGLAIISFFVSIFLFIKIRKTLYSENYSVFKKTGLILLFVILMPILTNAADVGQVVAAMYDFNIDGRLAVISGVQENYIQMNGEIKFAIMNFLSDGYFSPSTVQTSVSMAKIDRIREYTDDANENFKTCLSQLEDKVLHGAISRVSGDDFKACLYTAVKSPKTGVVRGQDCNLGTFSKGILGQTFNSNGATTLMTTSAVAIDSDSILIAFGEGSGKFVVVNTMGNIELSATTFHNGTTFGPSVALIDSDSVFIFYRDGGDNEQGKYVVVNPFTGILERSETVFHPSSTGWYYFTAVADPSTVLIAYRDDNDGKKGKFMVVNPQTGNVKVSEITFSSTMINTVAVTALDSTHVLISYQEFPSHNSYFLIVNPQTGDIVLPKTSFEQSFGIPSTITINSTHALIIYRDLNNYGKFIVVNTVTGEKTPPKTYSVYEPYDSSVSSAMLDSNSVFISYWKPSKAIGNFVVYNIDGTPEISETTFNDNGATYNTAAVSLGCKVLIAYQDASDHQYGKFVVYTSEVQ